MRLVNEGQTGGPAVEVSRLRKTYPGGVEAVKGIDFAVERGEVFGLLGPNGAGKSTTIGILTTTIAPTSGTARLTGIDVTVDPISARRASSVVFQEPVVDRALTGMRNLEIHARLWGLDAAEARRSIGTVVDALGLAGLVGRAVGTYSGGERRRLEIARALVSQPRVLFLDEPTVGLDPRIRHELLDVIASLRERSELSILITTHYLDEAEELCDRLAVIHAGQIVALGTPAALIAEVGREVVELRTDRHAERALALLQERGISSDGAFTVGSRMTVPLQDHSADDAVAAIREAGHGNALLGTRRPTLDDVYLRLTSHDMSVAA